MNDIELREEVITDLMLAESYIDLADFIYTQINDYKPSSENSKESLNYINHPTVEWLQYTANSYFDSAILEVANLLATHREDTRNLSTLFTPVGAQDQIEKFQLEFKPLKNIRDKQIGHKDIKIGSSSLFRIFSTYKSSHVSKLKLVIKLMKDFIGQYSPPVLGNNFILDHLQPTKLVVTELLDRTLDNSKKI